MVEDKKVSRDELATQVKRFKTDAGQKPLYSDNSSEYLLKLKRQYESIVKMGEDYVIGCRNWLSQATKFRAKDQELIQMIEKIRIKCEAQ